MKVTSLHTDTDTKNIVGVLSRAATRRHYVGYIISQRPRLTLMIFFGFRITYTHLQDQKFMMYRSGAAIITSCVFF